MVRYLSADQLLVRLEHFFAPEESELSLPASVSLQKLLSVEGYGLGNVTAVNETTLGGNQWKATTTTSEIIAAPNFDVTLKPFEIRSSIVTLE